MAKNPNYRRTKRSTQLATRIFSIDDCRNIIIRIKKLEGLSESSINGYEKLFNDFDRYFGEKTDINSLTAEQARGFMDWQLNEKTQFLKSKYRKDKKKGVSISSANTYLTLAKAVFYILIDEGIIEENIFEGIRNIKKRQKKVETLTVDEIKKILRSLDKGLYSEMRMHVILNCLLDGFGRINETLTLKKSDIDYDGCTITFTNTKNKRIRHVPITRKTVKLIEELNEETEDFDSEYIFLTNHGKPLRPDTFRKHLRVVLQRIGINKRIHPHMFRHSSSAIYLQQPGASITVLQKILGHADLSTTQIYTHILDSTVRESHAKFSPINFIDQSEKRKTRTGRGRVKGR
ncbi:hypothetical protein EVU96_24730 [Bacillus infantis]|uniref:tyrosine-type recombinase/integrase n=1 Tax=Bacillus infantis TaxID=324767 RepID=UPI00101D292A|nr:tyrosine-type recombinase/integrase [Bacillus infantis]RYI25174.1 hypothetical protein EVU96_24730 [Bacillus infantis]